MAATEPVHEVFGAGSLFYKCLQKAIDYFDRQEGDLIKELVEEGVTLPNAGQLRRPDPRAVGGDIALPNT